MDIALLLEQLRYTLVDIPGTSNTRDLGGYPAGPGRMIGPGILFRGEALAHPGPTVRRVAEWRDDARDRYRALRLATVIDLRAADEAALAPSAWAESTNALLESIPIDEGGEGDATDYMRQLRAGTLREFGPEELADYYFRTVRARAPQLGLALRSIAGTDALPVLVHCAAGKDRTGLLIAMLLEILGVPREIVVADYALTSAFRPNRVEAYADVLADAGIAPEDVSALFEAPPEAMRLLLEGLDTEYGSVRDFLQAEAGLDDAVFAALERAMLVPVG